MLGAAAADIITSIVFIINNKNNHSPYFKFESFLLT